ncbi:MAG: rod shape-determining protein MreC [Deltaproteobacteria bacterium]|nr:rod shape-determining protein MreC [Deltaproteobacteria bacterium]
MSELLRRSRVPLLFAGLLLLTLVLILVDRRRGILETGAWPERALLELAAPIQQVVSWPGELLGESWQRYIALAEVQQENELLRQRVTALEEENLQYAEALVASGHLARIVQMRADFEIPLLPCEVVGQNIKPWSRTLTLNRGREDRVQTGMPVVVAHGLVGLISLTSQNTARTTLLLDRRSLVDAIVRRSRARGIVQGRGSGDLEFELLVRGDDVRAGDELITSGVGGVFPKGLRIGTVRQVNTGSAEVRHTAQIQPAVDFGRLEHVSVMLQLGPDVAKLYGSANGQRRAEAAP